MRRRAIATLALLAAGMVAGAGCSQGDAERLGDEAYGGGRYAEALATYQGLAGSGAGARVWAKIGASALAAGRLAEATEAYLHLAGEDPTRLREATAALGEVARAAERSGDESALMEAILALQTVAPDAVPGRYALVLASQSDVETEELLTLLPGAIAAAADGSTVDSLLYRYGRVLQATGGCGQALLQYRAVLRRTQDSTLRARAGSSAGDCAYDLGRRARSAGRDEDAALWFIEAARTDTSSVTGRRALIGLGDIRLQQGDTLAAALAFQAAVSASSTDPDSVTNAAAARLARLGLFSSTGENARPSLP